MQIIVDEGDVQLVHVIKAAGLSHKRQNILLTECICSPQVDEGKHCQTSIVMSSSRILACSLRIQNCSSIIKCFQRSSFIPVTNNPVYLHQKETINSINFCGYICALCAMQYNMQYACGCVCVCECGAIYVHSYVPVPPV